MQHLLEIAGLGPRTLPLIALVFCRTLPALFMNPFLGGQAVPAQAKMGFAGALTVLLLPHLAHAPDWAGAGTPLGWMMAKELCVGATLGFVSSVMFWGFALAGRLIDTQRGANIAETMAYQMRERTSHLGQFYFQTAIVLFLLLNGHHLFIEAFFKSFQVLPVWEFPRFALVQEQVALDLIGVTQNLFVIGLKLSAPAVIALFLTDVAFGILSRSAPQIRVYELAQPVKLGLGLLVLWLVLKPLFATYPAHFDQMLEDVRRFIQYLAR